MSSDGARRKGIALTDRQRIAWLRLIRSDNVGPSTFRDLINHFGSAEAAIAALPELSKRGGAARSIRIASVAEAERELERISRIGARLVGSRNASISGAKFAAMIARDCVRAGYTVTSGLARGIDTAAHRASLEGGTIAVLAGGIDQPYPPENIPLLDQITGGDGLAVSEMPFGWEPRARDFPRRNRLIAGISLGVVVIEAAERSGSLITARMAADFGRLVFAVPGSPLDPRCHGTNGLLKDGAIVTTGSEDVLAGLSPLSDQDLFSPPVVDEPGEERDLADMLPPNDDERGRIIDALGPTPVEVDDIIRHTEVAAATVYLVLLELDLAGRLHRHPGGLVSLAMLV